MEKNRHKVFTLLLLLFILLYLFYFDVTTGSVNISWSSLWNIIIGNESESIESIIVNEIRIPVALMAMAVGSSLSLSGCLLQTILNNPLASPFSLGISAAAGFGAALSIVYGSTFYFLNHSFLIAISAFFFAFLSSLFVYFCGTITKGNSATLILVGIATFFAFQAALSAIQYFASPEESQYIVFWLFGSLAKADLNKVKIVFGVFLVCAIYSLMNSWALTALRLGDDGASAVGVPIKKMRLSFFFIASLLTSTSIAFVGIIGFIGIISPHIARMLVGEDHRFLILGSILLGGVFLVLASVVSKLIVDGVVFPVGIVTAIFGVPLFLFLILWNRKKVLWN